MEYTYQLVGFWSERMDEGTLFLWFDKGKKLETIAVG